MNSHLYWRCVFNGIPVTCIPAIEQSLEFTFIFALCEHHLYLA